MWRFVFVIFICNSGVSVLSTSAKLSLYGKGHPEPTVIHGSDCPFGATFDIHSNDFTCACMTGLWAFYDDTCSQPNIISGGMEEMCIQINKKVRKVHLLSSPSGSGDAATVFSDDMKITKTRIEYDGLVKSVTFNASEPVKVVATGTKGWGLEPLDSCLAPELPDETLFGSSPQFCTYPYTATGKAVLRSHCDRSKATLISPSTCLPFLEASAQCVPSGSSVASKGRGIVKTASKDKAKVSSKSASASPKGRAPLKVAPAAPKKKVAVTGTPVAPKDRVSLKSAAAAPKGKASLTKVPATPKGRGSVKSTPVAPKGRGFVKASPVAHKGRSSVKAAPPKEKVATKGGRASPKTNQGRVFLPLVKGLTNNTRNVSAMTKHNINKNLTVNMAHPEMNSELWNYLTSRAQTILNLTTEPVTTVPITPTFRFLNLAKEILQKACPDSYVANEHFDMALGAFTSLQTRIFNFKDAFADYATGLRIEESLKFCRDNITTYPFVDMTNRTKETCNKTMQMGMFKAFGNFTELIMPSTAASRENEPIVETVWKIFTHAHSACYNHFAEGFNDHHRFTSIIMPLFTNEINDIWNSIKEVKKDAYSGLLGDAVKLMDGVAYCAEFSRLDTPYPWELPRPVKDNNSVGRKRRAAVKNNSKFTCLKKTFENTC